MNDENNPANDQLPLETGGNQDAAQDSAGAAARIKRISEYIGESLARSDGLAANLGVINGELMLLRKQLAQLLESLFSGDPEEVLARCYPAIELLLRMDKQIERYSNLDVELRGSPGT
jgi:hypothetical protein